MIFQPAYPQQPRLEKKATTEDTSSNLLLHKIRDLETNLKEIQSKEDSSKLALTKINDSLNKLASASPGVWQYFAPILLTLLAGSIALLQVKGNNISAARVEWVEHLRVAASELISEVEILNEQLREVKEFIAEKKIKQSENAFRKATSDTKKLRALLYKVKLYLSPEDPKHKQLDQKLDEYTRVFVEDYDQIDNLEKLETLSDSFVAMMKSVLKEAWEDAKSTKISDVFKFKL
jgi:CRISPR/Cas system CSM-associated protein Csm2 small subunit